MAVRILISWSQIVSLETCHFLERHLQEKWAFRVTMEKFGTETSNKKIIII